MSTTHKLYGERINPSKQQLKRKLRQATVEDGFKMKPGYLYTVVRAISARVNQNYDGWPSDELKKSYHTFIGKPVFVNHENYDPETARGVVVAARYVENGRDKYVEVIQEIDAPTFPLLAHEIKTGGLDSVSMGAEAGFTICSVCDNKAVDERDMCQHVMFHKGEMLPRRNKRTGKMERVLCYESCHKLGFFELSYVFDPADETAVASKVLMASEGVGRTAGKYTKEDFAIQDGKMPWEREVADPELEDAVVTAFRKGAPFAEYDDFADCENKNSDKDSPSAYCGEIKHRTEDKEGARFERHPEGWQRVREQDEDPTYHDQLGLGDFGDERGFEAAVLRAAGFKAADNECLPGEDCDTGTAGPSGPDVKSDPNLQPLTPGAGSGGGSSSAPAAGTSAPVSADGGAAAGGSGATISGDGSIPLVQHPDGTWHSTNPAWDHLIDRESGGRADITQQITDSNSGGNEAQGLFQITPQTWKSNGGVGNSPGQASPQEQAEVAKHIFERNPSGSDWGAGMAGRENASELAQGIGHPASPNQLGHAASFQARVLTAAGFQAPPAENSMHTQVSNTMPTYQKAHTHLDAAGAPQGNTLDYGAGLGHSSQFGDTFEPHPQKGFQPTHQRTEDIPDGGYHRVTNLNVLNVVPPQVRDRIVDEIGRVMAPGGHGVITTRGRNEVLSTKGGIPANNGDPNAIIVGKGGPKERYQKGFDPKELHQYVSGRLGDGYDVSPLKLGPAGVHIVRKAGTTASTRRKAWGETEAPTRIDTLREEGSAPEDDSDDFYHFVESPRELRTPDLSQAGDIDREQDEQGQGPEDMPGGEEGPGAGGDDDGGQYITLKIPVPPQAQSDVLPTQPFDAGPAPAPPGPQGGPPPGAMPPPGPEGPPPPGMPPGPPVPPEQQQIAASTLDYFNRYFGHRVANWYDAIAQGREMTAAERADYQLQTSTLRNTPVVSTTSRTPKEGTANMGRSTLAERGKTASRGRRQHFAEGPLTDGGDVSRNDQGEQEEAFISETPPAEAVVAPTDDTPNISNTENNLVARVQLGQQQLLRDAQALAALRARQGRRRTAEEMTEAGGPVATPVDPPLSGTKDQDLKGDDFQSANPNDGAVATNPHDASLKAFKVFDRWLKKKTGRSSNQHTAATIRRYAEHYANATDTPIQAYFPALGIVLREARKNEKATNVKGAKMRKRSNESLDVAAPDGRADVEAPTEGTTDADAQASQFDTRDFGNNAGDDIAKPDLSTDQNFAPGEANKTGRAKTAGELLGIQCAEAMIEAGLEPNDRKRKYALAAEFGRMNRGLILDRIALAERFASVLNQTHAHYARKVASGGTRGTTRSPLPPGMSGGSPRQMTAGSRRTAANDPSNDSLMFG